MQSRPTIADCLLLGDQATPDIVTLTPDEYLSLPQVEVAQYQTGVAAWAMESSLQITLLRRNTVKARPMLHHLLSGWGDFAGGKPSWQEQLRILNDWLLAQRTVYAALREFGTLVVGEAMRQQAFFEHHAQAAATRGTEQEQRDDAAHRAQQPADHMQLLARDNTRLFESSAI